MGTSHPETKPWVIRKIAEAPTPVKYILDVGAGGGDWQTALRAAGYPNAIDAVEVWQPYIDQFNLKARYGSVYADDIRQFDDFIYDVVIFGDVLEHMTKEEAVDVWDRASIQATYGVIAIPTIHYHQPAMNGNPYEEHIKEDWSHEEVMDTFPFIVDSWQGQITSAYWAVFDN